MKYGASEQIPCLYETFGLGTLTDSKVFAKEVCLRPSGSDSAVKNSAI